MKLILLAVCFGNIIVAIQSLDLLYEWRYVDYVWHSKEQKLNAIRTGEYNFTSIQMIDVDMAKDGRVFVTNIRSEGAPASLSTVSKFRGEGGPLLKPYPDWSWYKRGDCNGITSVYRVRIDECNKLYVLDTGVIDTVRICPAQLLVFDLHNDKLVKRITIPDNVARNASGQGLLITPIVVTSHTCALESVYIADTVGRGLVIMNSKRTFRLEADVFQPEDYYSNISVADKSFFLDDSLFGMALATPNPDYGETSHELYLRPLASRSLFAANCAVLDRSTNGNAIRYKIEPGMLPSQGTAMDFSADGTLFFGLTREIAIGCWNRHREMKPENIDIVLQDYHRLQFPSGLKIIPRDRSQSGSEEILIMSNTFQDLATDSRNFNLVNFRVMRSTVDPLTRGTKCTPPPRESSSFDHKPFHHHGRQPQRRPQSHY